MQTTFAQKEAEEFQTPKQSKVYKIINRNSSIQEVPDPPRTQDMSNLVLSDQRLQKPRPSKDKQNLFLTQYNTDYKRFNEIEPSKKQIYELLDNMTKTRGSKDCDMGIGIKDNDNTVIKLEPSQTSEKFLYSITTRDFKVPKQIEKKAPSNPPQMFPIRKNINFVEYNMLKQYETKNPQPKDNMKEIIKRNEEEDLLYKKELVYLRKQEKEIKRSMIEQEKGRKNAHE